MKEQIKIFSKDTRDYGDIEESINEWIEDNNIEIIRVLQSESSYYTSSYRSSTLTISIFYHDHSAHTDNLPF